MQGIQTNKETDKMATMTGANLLNSIIESSSVEVNSLISLTLSAKLQQMIDNGTYSKLAASIAISGFSTAINAATNINELSDTESSDYAIANEGTDVTLSYNYNDEGIMDVVTLAGAVTADDLVYDQASLTAAMGFDMFGA
jgi:hypothetical protein